MSRRKQAKPRAVLKHGVDDELQQDLKEEAASDEETEDEYPNFEDENNRSKDGNRETATIDDLKMDECAEIDDDEVEDEDLSIGNHISSVTLVNNNEDDNSSDSFYSDLYSTHTSSTYSPSMSEGAATPNSLIHHHIHHSGLHRNHEGEDNRLRDSEKPDSVNGNEEDDEQGSGNERIEFQKHTNNEDKSTELRMGDGKISAKIRKIDRDVAKSEKMTSDGIKTTSDGSYQCQFCDKSFPRLGYLKKHEQSHAEHLPFKCEYCARLFKHKRSRDRHTKLHTGDRRYRCPHCEAAFSRSDHLKIHMKTHDNQKPYQCTVCNRGYNTAAALTSHMQNHKKQASLLGAGQSLNYSPRSTGSGSSNGSYHKRRYIPADCNSPSRIDYRKHSRSTNISCIYCTKSDFVSMEQLNSHIQGMHESLALRESLTPQSHLNHPVFQLSCEYCTMKFPNVPAMFQHMRTSHIDRLASPNSYFEHFNRLAASGTFSPRLLANNSRFDEVKVKVEENSPQPDKQVAESEKDEEQISPTDLSQPRNKSPKRSEYPRKPTGAFLCNQCNAGLPDFETFRIHLKTHITPQAITSLVCQHCGVTLRDQAEHDRHVVSHFVITTSEYSCSQSCSKAFPKADELQKHLFDCHVQTIYKCGLCQDVFDTKVAIQVHFACTHSNESKIFRCSACMENFRDEKDFTTHVRTRHTTNTGSIQCMFCRAVCSSELEMHFHLAAHARQFRCPSCPETFHVEFLLDRHMQTHHTQKDHTMPGNSAAGSTYHTSYNKQQHSLSNNNNNILDYHALASGKAGLFQLPSTKFYNPLQIETNPLTAKHSALLYGLGQRYFDANKTLVDMYNYHHQENKSNSNYFVNPTSFEVNNRVAKTTESKTAERSITNGFSCGICERSDFRTETEVHSHRKIVHNLKTGVSLRCAYCSGNFKSRNELEHHMKTCHNSTGKHKCLICDEIFPSPAILAEHKLQHSKVGQSGKCSHCSASLNDVSAFKSHLSEHNGEGHIPVQCICCRQTLNSDFEVGLHAKFHTKASNSPENLCALCLEALPVSSEARRVCDKCCRKHNLNSKFNMRYETTRADNRCNLCKVILPHAQRLQEHLVEHTFMGCEDRGYICYICSAVFTVPAGLLSHIQEHGQNARPYDCNLCSEKYFFRAELENHLIEHEVNNSKTTTAATANLVNEVKVKNETNTDSPNEKPKEKSKEIDTLVKTEAPDDENEDEEEEEEEYIEVEKVPDNTSIASMDEKRH